MPYLEIQDGGQVFCTHLSKFKAFLSQFAFQNNENIIRTVLVTLIGLNTSNLSKTFMLEFKN